MNLLRFLLLICTIQSFSVMAQPNQVLSKTDRQFCARFSGVEKEMCDQSNYPPCNTVNTGKCFGVLQYQSGSKYVGERNGNFRFGMGQMSNPGLIITGQFDNDKQTGWATYKGENYTKRGYYITQKTVIEHFLMNDSGVAIIKDNSLEGKEITIFCNKTGEITSKKIKINSTENSSPVTSLDSETYPCGANEFKIKYQKYNPETGINNFCDRLNESKNEKRFAFQVKQFKWRMGTLDALETIYNSGAKIVWWDTDRKIGVATDIVGLKRSSTSLQMSTEYSHVNDAEWRNWYFNKFGINHIDWTIGGLPINILRTDAPEFLGERLISWKTDDPNRSGSGWVNDYNYDNSCPAFLVGHPTPDEIEGAISIYSKQYGEPKINNFISYNKGSQIQNFTAEWFLEDGTFIRLTKFINLMPQEQWRKTYDFQNCLKYQSDYSGLYPMYSNKTGHPVLETMNWESAWRNPCSIADHPRKSPTGEVIFISPSVAEKYITANRNRKKNDF